MNRLLLLFTLLLASILPAAAQRTVSICMVGDIMPGTTYPDSTTLAFLSRTPEKLFEKTSHIFKGADLTIGNLESTLVDIGDASPRKKAVGNNYIFRTPTQYAGIMKKAGIDVLTVANNHLFDFGAKGLKSTVGALDKAGIHYAGIRKAHMVTTVVRNNLTISICAFGHSSMSPSIFDFNAAEKLIDSLKRKSDIVVVSFHGGAEGVQHEHIPFREEMFHGERRGDVHAFAHRCVDAGADIVFGHGPHIVRGMELYKGRLIAYSLGNFCTPYRVSLEGTSKFAPAESGSGQRRCFPHRTHLQLHTGIRQRSATRSTEHECKTHFLPVEIRLSAVKTSHCRRRLDYARQHPTCPHPIGRSESPVRLQVAPRT